MCKHVVDGDTYDFLIDLGLYQYAYVTVRLADVDTPEIFGAKAAEEKEEGYKAKKLAEDLILNKHCIIETYKDKQSFGRFIARVFFRNDDGSMHCLGCELIKAGFG